MPKVSLVGDPNSGGGVIIASTQSTVSINGRLVATDGSPVSGHGKGVHQNPVTIGRSNGVFIEGKQVTLVGTPDTCGHIRMNGSADVSIGS